MKKFLKILFILVVVLLVGVTLFYFYFKSSLTPTYEGELSLDGLNGKVEVYYTDHGIPHIYADNTEDAYYAFGYIHAQDRLWQMDLLRKVGSGRLSELFGKDLVETDKYLRTMGLDEYSRQSAQDYLERGPTGINELQSYVDGINAFINNNPRTLEHQLLGVEPEPFVVQNIFEVLTYMSFSFQNAQKTDPVLTEIVNKLDSSYLDDLNIYHYEGQKMIKSYDARYSSLAMHSDKILQSLRVPQFIGSNSWVLSGQKTESGKPVLVNDPHIAFAQPAVWYEAHMVTPEKEYYGYHVAGVPFPLLLHNESCANGLTMFENDDMDFYIEEIHSEDSNVYRHRDEWKEMTQREETIQIKGEPSEKLTIRSTVHGPVVSDIIIKDFPLPDAVTMYWTFTNHSNYTMDLLYQMSTATTLEQMEEAAGNIHAPGLNFMYGDAEGNIAWWASAKLIKRQNERASKTFYDGASGLFDPDSSYSFEKNPHTINPPWGYVYSANNQPDTVDGVLYAGYYLPDDRGERIMEILDQERAFTIDDMKVMLTDNQSKMMEAIKGILLYHIKDSVSNDLLTELRSWNHTFDADDFRPLLFQKWIYEILEASQKDELGDTLWAAYQGSHQYKVSIEHLIKNNSSKWWDNVATEEKETRAQVITQAFEETMKDLKNDWGDDYRQWRWGDSHVLIHNHAMGEALNFLNVGTFSISGANEVINNMGYTYTGEKIQSALLGPSTRRIVDFSDVRNNSWSILPSGQSGNFFSPYYDDQAVMYATDQFRKMMMNHEEIKNRGSRLHLIPKN